MWTDLVRTLWEQMGKRQTKVEMEQHEMGTQGGLVRTVRNESLLQMTKTGDRYSR